MSNFTKIIKRTYDFEGDTVAVSMKRLKRKHALKLIPFMGEPDEDGKVSMDLNKSMEFMNIAAEMLVKYIVTFNGLFDAEKNELTAEQVFGDDAESYFINLASEIMSDLMEASFVKPKEEKKSVEQPKNISEVSDIVHPKASLSEE